MTAIRLLAVLLTALALGACEDAPSGGTDVKGDSATGDVPLATDATGTLADTVDLEVQYACPGGHGCACQTDTDCTASGRCLQAPDLTKTCALPCPQTTCAAGWTCAALLATGSAQAGTFCVPRGGHLCDPCTKSSDCEAIGLGGAACVDYGPAGGFCGVQCLGDADCAQGYACRIAQRVEGGQTQQCVRMDGDVPFAICACSPRAVSLALETTCKSANCQGKRGCGGGTLSACSAPSPAAESCNGQDDDCDGQSDEGTCDDGNPCTKDTCNGSGGCQHAPADGAACEADNTACTQGDTCQGGACVAGKKLECDDGDPCSDDSCDANLGCLHVFAPNEACDDGNPCTQGEACQGGVCKGGAAVLCDDKNPCTEDKCSVEAKGCSSKPVDGAPCDDGNACTLGDGCKGGGCLGTGDKCDDGSACTQDSCDPKTGCAHTPVTDGNTCDDGNPCSLGEACAAGACTGGQAKVCPGVGACVTGLCSPLTGQCGTQLAPEGKACSDGSACTSDDGCAKGSCVGKAVSCDDKNACTADACLPASGCSHTDTTAPCSDGDACTDKDACAGGKCAGLPLGATACDDSNPCTTDACDKTAGCTHLAKTGACDDGDACTEGDACQAGQCKPGTNACACSTNDDCKAKEDGDLCNGTLFCDTAATTPICKIDPKTVVVCPGGGDGPCEKNLCEKTNGKCQMTPVDEGKACDDGSACTDGDACKAGDCTGTAKPCDDQNACTSDSCDATGGCVHLANTATCDADADACTADVCKDKTCTAGSAKPCDDSNPCTSDSCDAKTGGCNNDAIPGGKACDDGDPCTEKDACDAGTCKGGAPPAAVTTLAGSGTKGWADGKGTQAQFAQPFGIAIGPGGVAYVTDAAVGNSRIRKVAVDGTVTTLAGQGTSGWKDGPGASARFWAPAGLAVAADGTVYVADRFNQRIRVVSADGTVTTLAGDAPEPDFGVQKADGGWVDGQGTVARFDEPMGLALDATAGVLWVAEAANHRIRKVTLQGLVTTVAGSGVAGWKDAVGQLAQFTAPAGVAVAADGTIFVADAGNHRIRHVAADGTVTTVAGTGTAGLLDGAALQAQFNGPIGLVIDTAGALYLADTLNNVLRTLAGGQVALLAGVQGPPSFADGTPKQAKFAEPFGIAWSGPGLWLVADTLNHRVRKLSDPALACVPKK